MSGRAVSRCFQVCWSVENKDTAEREIRGLLDALHAHKLDQGIILTNDEHGAISRDGKRIFIKPLWHFALSPRE
jgi:hypothetical protein